VVDTGAGREDLLLTDFADVKRSSPKKDLMLAALYISTLTAPNTLLLPI
jgi:hypothetical protein